MNPCNRNQCKYIDVVMVTMNFKILAIERLTALQNAAYISQIYRYVYLKHPAPVLCVEKKKLLASDPMMMDSSNSSEEECSESSKFF